MASRATSAAASRAASGSILLASMVRQLTGNMGYGLPDPEPVHKAAQEHTLTPWHDWHTPAVHELVLRRGHSWAAVALAARHRAGLSHPPMVVLFAESMQHTPASAQSLVNSHRHSSGMGQLPAGTSMGTPVHTPCAAPRGAQQAAGLMHCSVTKQGDPTEPEPDPPTEEDATEDDETEEDA
jgi:hypothetical protein